MHCSLKEKKEWRDELEVTVIALTHNAKKEPGGETLP